MTAGTDPVDRDFRESQIRMEGKLDRIGDEIKRQSEDMRDLRQTVGRHGDRLGLLERDKNLRDGERKGIGLSGKILISVISLAAGTGIGASLLEVLK